MADLTDADQEQVRRVNLAFRQAEPFHRMFIDKCEHFYARYRNFQQWRTERSVAREADRDSFFNDSTRDWGAKLSIPFGFSTIETIVPRLLSNAPRFLVLPRDRQAAENVRNMKALVDFQQDNIDLELVGQDVVKDGLMYGLGVLKTFWRTEKRKARQNVRAIKATQENPGGFASRPEEITVFDGNDCEAVSIWDWFWDPFGYDMRTVDWVIHRVWLSHDQVMRRVQNGTWRQDFTEDEIRTGGSQDKMQEVWAGRMTAQGFRRPDVPESKVHEVWEFHDREQVITVLDRRLPVQQGENPYWHGELPFQIYRPTRLNKELPGVSELEPLQDLLDEIDTLRSQRRDNATLVLQRTFAYQEGLVDPADLKFGPGIGIPTQGNPQEMVYPIPVGDIPNSGYAEEDRLLADIERTSGISDAVSGGEGNTAGASATATGAQLVHAAANVRIQNKTMNFEKETLRHGCRQWVSNNQQKVISQTIPVQKGPRPGNDEPAYDWLELSPEELAGRFAVVPEGGATAPDNVPQMRQDAQIGSTMFLNNPSVDQRQALSWLLKNMGVENPEAWLVQGQQVPAAVLEFLKQNGVDEKLIVQALQQADQAQQGQPPQPGQGQNGASGQPGQSGGSQGSPSGSQNGSGGPPVPAGR